MIHIREREKNSYTVCWTFYHRNKKRMGILMYDVDLLGGGADRLVTYQQDVSLQNASVS